MSFRETLKSRKAVAVSCVVAVATMSTGLVAANAAMPARYSASACYAVATKPVLRQRAVGNCVALLQWDLTQEGYPTTIDGKFGTTTRNNLTMYQQREQLTVDGIAGSMTWMKLADNPAPPLPGADYTQCIATLPKPTLRMGSRGNCVAVLQWDLGKEGYATNIDGKFGSMTKMNLIQYQTREGLTVDGIAGPMAWAKLADNNVVQTPMPTPMPTPAPSDMATPLPTVTVPMTAAPTTTIPPGSVGTPMPQPLAQPTELTGSLKKKK